MHKHECAKNTEVQWLVGVVGVFAPSRLNTLTLILILILLNTRSLSYTPRIVERGGAAL